MLYADSKGRIYLPEEVDALPYWEIEEMGIHVFEGEPGEMFI